VRTEQDIYSNTFSMISIFIFHVYHFFVPICCPGTTHSLHPGHQRSTQQHQVQIAAGRRLCPRGPGKSTQRKTACCYTAFPSVFYQFLHNHLNPTADAHTPGAARSAGSDSLTSCPKFSHRITECLGLAGPSVGHPAQPPAQAGSPRAGCKGPCPGGA